LNFPSFSGKEKSVRDRIRIPEDLAVGHATEGLKTGLSDNAAKLADRCAETFVLWGGLDGAKAVLDIGCGPGRMAIGIGERFGYTNPYLGFEIKKADIDFCTAEITSRFSNFQFRHLDIRNGHYNPAGAIDPADARFPAQDGAFDFAFATSVFTHMFTEEMTHYVREARRCLRAGGTFVATYFAFDAVPPAGARFDFSERWDDHCFVAFRDRPEKAVGYPIAFLRETFAKCGFRDLAHHAGEWTGLKGGRHSQDYLIAVAR